MVGDPEVFAIESALNRAFESVSFYGLGYFLIHLRGVCYGVRADDATALACSVDEVRARISDRGKHLAAGWDDLDAFAIAHAFRAAVYDPGLVKDPDLAGRLEDFAAMVWASKLAWAPDGDEAFDDGSYVLQIDAGSLVRLIGFKGTAGGLGLSRSRCGRFCCRRGSFMGFLRGGIRGFWMSGGGWRRKWLGEGKSRMGFRLEGADARLIADVSDREWDDAEVIPPYLNESRRVGMGEFDGPLGEPVDCVRSPPFTTREARGGGDYQFSNQESRIDGMLPEWAQFRCERTD
jgi:hypothetical protein